MFNFISSAASEAATRPVWALLVADNVCGAAAGDALARAVDVASASVSVVTLRERENRVLRWLAPTSGMITTAAMDEEALRRADKVACEIARGLDAAHVDHQVALSWAGVEVMLRRGSYDVAVIACVPHRRRDLNALVAVSSAHGTALVLAGA